MKVLPAVIETIEDMERVSQAAGQAGQATFRCQFIVMPAESDLAEDIRSVGGGHLLKRWAHDTPDRPARAIFCHELLKHWRAR